MVGAVVTEQEKAEDQMPLMRRSRARIGYEQLAAIEYHGMRGISASCLNAVRRILQFGDRPERAILLTAGNTHALLLTGELLGDIAIKRGFTSGYSGEGPSALADALCLLLATGIDVEEVRVPEDLLERLDLSAMTTEDLELCKSLPPVRPIKIYDYIYDLPNPDTRKRTVWKQFPEVMPWHIIDERLYDLASSFVEEPDQAIINGFRRLEDLMRDRIKSNEHGAKLFSNAFGGDDPALVWMREEASPCAVGLAATPEPQQIEKSEQVGRMQLFTGSYQAFRNPRAHRLLSSTSSSELSEFLTLNQLFLLERAAVEKAESVAASKSP